MEKKKKSESLKLVKLKDAINLINQEVNLLGVVTERRERFDRCINGKFLSIELKLGRSSRWSSWSSRWLPPSSFAYPVELRPCTKSFLAPHVPYAPKCSKRPISKDQTCISPEPENYWYRVCEGQASKYVERPWHSLWKSKRLMNIVSEISGKMDWDFDAVHVLERGGYGRRRLRFDSLPSLGEVYAKIVREEQRLTSAKAREQQQEAIGFVTRRKELPTFVRPSQTETRSDSATSIRRDRNALCSHCGRSGHEKKEGWQLVGFPEWWLDRNKNPSGGRDRGGGRGDTTTLVVDVVRPMLHTPQVPTRLPFRSLQPTNGRLFPS
ncbi:unnamed protein product [Microthlaspi erraticum]|uniref:DUF7075 domain-containing protein n=1 Tax=Microthlaspi erraticum TaxID=1685480 RepID=A0A6D2KWW0_9BRAS|nr:unnamed protein product [Microthlaspi erraticum]